MRPNIPSAQLLLCGGEFCSTAAGLYCTMLLADMRRRSSRSKHGMATAWANGRRSMTVFSENFASLDWNKKSVVLDWEQPIAFAVGTDAFDW